MVLGGIQRVGDQRSRVALRALAGAGLLTTGRIHVVKSADDADRREVQGNFPPDVVFTDIASAIAACLSGASDYVLVCPKLDGSNWEITAQLALNKVNMHLVGVGGDSRPKINATGVRVLEITAAGVEVASLEAESTTGTAARYSSGRLYIHDCRLRGGTSGGYDFQCNTGGQAFQMDRCVIGNTTDHDAETCIDFAATAGAGTTIISDCEFLHKAEAVGDEFILAQAGATLLIVRRCRFFNANVGVTDMTQAISATNMAVAQDCMAIGADTLLATGKLCVPAGMGLTVALADVFNPGLAIDGAEPVAADT